MQYKQIVSGIFIDRPNRFIAHVNIENEIYTVHVKNTGRCKELLVPGCTVILEDFRNRPEEKIRKTLFDIIAVYKNGNLLINMDSQAPNKVVYEWLSSLKGERSFSFIKPEYTFGDSRIDFYMERNSQDPQGHPYTQKFLMEVKGCTLEKDGIGYFPDAPTQRGVKHLNELAKASQQGYKCYLAFVIQIPKVNVVLPNNETHPEFGKALDEAKAAGVEVLFLCCDVQENHLKIIS